MKVVLAIKRLASAPGGAERVLCNLHSYLVERGYEVCIITFESPGRVPFYPLGSQVDRIDLGIGDAFKPAGWIETLLRIKALRQAIRSERPDVVIGFMHSMFVPVALALVGTGIPIVGSEHIVPEHYKKRPLEFLLFMLASLFLDRITVLSSTIRMMYPAIIRKRMVAVPNPVKSAENFVEVGNEIGNFTLLSVGRLDAQKDHETLIRAFAQISHKFPQWRLKIVGEGAMRLELESLIEALHLQGRVILPGTTRLISKEYLAAELFVMSSRYEAFGMATAEAMSHGLPVVGFADCPGTNELIEDGKTGVLVEPVSDRIVSLAFGLSKLMSEPSLRKTFGMAGREVMKRKFSPGSVLSQWESLLLSISRGT